MAQKGIFIRGARVLDPSSGMDGTADVRIDGDRITAVGHGPFRRWLYGFGGGRPLLCSRAGGYARAFPGARADP